MDQASNQPTNLSTKIVSAIGKGASALKNIAAQQTTVAQEIKDNTGNMSSSQEENKLDVTMNQANSQSSLKDNSEFFKELAKEFPQLKDMDPAAVTVEDIDQLIVEVKSQNKSQTILDTLVQIKEEYSHIGSPDSSEYADAQNDGGDGSSQQRAPNDPTSMQIDTSVQNNGQMQQNVPYTGSDVREPKFEEVDVEMTDESGQKKMVKKFIDVETGEVFDRPPTIAKAPKPQEASAPVKEKAQLTPYEEDKDNFEEFKKFMADQVNYSEGKLHICNAITTEFKKDLTKHVNEIKAKNYQAKAYQVDSDDYSMQLKGCSWMPKGTLPIIYQMVMDITKNMTATHTSRFSQLIQAPWIKMMKLVTEFIEDTESVLKTTLNEYEPITLEERHAEYKEKIIKQNYKLISAILAIKVYCSRMTYFLIQQGVCLDMKTPFTTDDLIDVIDQISQTQDFSFAIAVVSARASVKVTECMGEYLHGEINNEEMDHLKIAKVYYALTVKDLIPIMRTYYKYKRFARDMNEATQMKTMPEFFIKKAKTAVVAIKETLKNVMRALEKQMEVIDKALDGDIPQMNDEGEPSMPSVIEMAKEIDGENENRIAKQKLVKMLFADVTDSDIHYDDKGIMLINKPCEPKDIVKKENIQDVNSLKIINDFIPKKIGIEKLISSSGECVLEFDQREEHRIRVLTDEEAKDLVRNARANGANRQQKQGGKKGGDGQLRVEFRINNKYDEAEQSKRVEERMSQGYWKATIGQSDARFARIGQQFTFTTTEFFEQVKRAINTRIEVKIKSVGQQQVNAELNNRKGMRYIYVLGTLSMMKFKRCELIDLITRCLHLGVPVEVLEEEIFNATNLCLYHLWGICIHPECQYSHDEDYFNILNRYQEQRKLTFNPTEGKPFVEYATRVGDATKSILFRLKRAVERHCGLNDKGKEQKFNGNYMKLIKDAMVQGRHLNELKERKYFRFVRQYLLGHVHEEDLALKNALLNIFVPAKIKPDGRSIKPPLREKLIDDVFKQFEIDKNFAKENADKFYKDKVLDRNNQADVRWLCDIYLETPRLIRLGNASPIQNKNVAFEMLRSNNAIYRGIAINSKYSHEVREVTRGGDPLSFDDSLIFDYSEQGTFRYGNFIDKHGFVTKKVELDKSEAIANLRFEDYYNKMVPRSQKHLQKISTVWEHQNPGRPEKMKKEDFINLLKLRAINIQKEKLYLWKQISTNINKQTNISFLGLLTDLQQAIQSERLIKPDFLIEKEGVKTVNELRVFRQIKDEQFDLDQETVLLRTKCMDCYKLRDGKDAIDLTRAVFDMKKDHYINLYMDNLPEIYHKLARYRSMKISTLTTEKTIYDLGKYNIENEIDKLWNISNRQYCIAYERSGLKEETLKMVSECYDRGKVGDYEFLTILMEQEPYIKKFITDVGKINDVRIWNTIMRENPLNATIPELQVIWTTIIGNQIGYINALSPKGIRLQAKCYNQIPGFQLLVTSKYLMLIDDENVEMEIEAANEADKLGDDKIKDTEMEEVEEEAMSLYKQIKKDVSSSKELRRNVPVQEFVKTKNIQMMHQGVQLTEELVKEVVKIQKDTTLTASEKAKNGTKKLEEALKKKRKIAKVKLATAGVVVGQNKLLRQVEVKKELSQYYKGTSLKKIEEQMIKESQAKATPNEFNGIIYIFNGKTKLVDEVPINGDSPTPMFNTYFQQQRDREIGFTEYEIVKAIYEKNNIAVDPVPYQGKCVPANRFIKVGEKAAETEKLMMEQLPKTTKESNPPQTEQPGLSQQSSQE